MKMSNHQSSTLHQPAVAPPLPVSMKQWTVGAVDSLRSKGKQNQNRQNLDEIVCSGEYLSCALKIAHSLTDQLSAIEEERGYKNNGKSYSQHNTSNIDFPPIKETANESWSEYISVYCTKKESAATEGETKDEYEIRAHKNNNIMGNEGSIESETADIEPLLHNNSDNLNQGELHNLAQQLSSTLLQHDENYDESADYLDVRGATLNEGAVDGRPLSNNGKLEIRSLGIVFYELFSGGHLTAGSGALVNMAAEADNGGDNESFGYNPTKRRSQSNTILDGNSTQKGVGVTSSIASISVEPLRLLGLPTALCDLISNMIDCVCVIGDTHGGNEEAYSFISEVRDDLKLMIDSPKPYLQGIDLANATNVGLQFGASLYGRESELQTLKECYQRSISCEGEVAMICGPSGIGKSKLSQEFARSIDENGESMFLSGRFDKLESQPLHAISSAFDKYCAWVSMQDQLTAGRVSSALKENLGEEMTCLVAVMPSLANILGDDFNSNQSNKNNTAVDAQKKLRYLFCQFVEVIATCHEEPLILFLDDCQWIDSASVALLCQILMMSGSSIRDHRFFFFGACRDDEMSESHPLHKMLLTVNSLCGTDMTKIHLTSMSKGALNEFVSTELSLLPRITRPLADILHHQTKGSPLFVKQVMMELYRQRILYPSLSRRRWVWEADKIEPSCMACVLCFCLNFWTFYIPLRSNGVLFVRKR